MIVDFNFEKRTADAIQSATDLNWLLSGIMDHSGELDFNIPISLNGEIRKVNIARLGTLYRLLTDAPSSHYGAKDILLGISDRLFGRYIGPSGMTYGSTGSWDKLNYFSLQVAGNHAKLTANYSLVTYDRKERHPEHPEDQTIIWETVTLDMIKRLELVNLMSAYSASRDVPVAEFGKAYTFEVDVVNTSVNFQVNTDVDQAIVNEDKVV